MNDTDTTTAPPAEADITFESLGVSPRLVKALAEPGINEPFAIQRLSIAHALAGPDGCGKAQTGSGKTIAFSITHPARPDKAEPPQPKGLVLLPPRGPALHGPPVPPPPP